MSALWTAAEAAAATGGVNTGAWTAGGVSIDSRSLLSGDLFVALKGPKFDGHDFVAAAFDRGAAAAMVAKAVAGTTKPQLIVGDTQIGLESLGRAARARTAARVIGITGSVGKTGTKEALRHALERQGATHASLASLNNQWGVPLSLARMPHDSAYAVFEMGMNHPSEIDALTRLVRPDIAVITAIEPAHLGFFSSVEAIADAKAEIFNGMDAHGCAVLNRDSPHFDRLAEKARAAGIGRIVDFGSRSDAAVHLIDCHLHASASAVTASVQGEIVDYCLSLPGRHWVMNSLAVLAAVKAAGADVGTAAASMATLEPMGGRGRRRAIAAADGDALLIDESYNASPASMRAAIAVLGMAEPQGNGRRIAVLGDMLELGAEAARLHAELAAPLRDAKVDLVFTVGDAMRALHDALPARRRGGHAATAAEIAETVARRLRRGDIVMVKGSYGTRMRDVVARLTTPAETARR